MFAAGHGRVQTCRGQTCFRGEHTTETCKTDQMSHKSLNTVTLTLTLKSGVWLEVEGGGSLFDEDGKKWLGARGASRVNSLLTPNMRIYL
jgi:hypothetical protein